MEAGDVARHKRTPADLGRLDRLRGLSREGCGACRTSPASDTFKITCLCGVSGTVMWSTTSASLWCRRQGACGPIPGKATEPTSTSRPSATPAMGEPRTIAGHRLSPGHRNRARIQQHGIFTVNFERPAAEVCRLLVLAELDEVPADRI
jgi:hypothetical protein